MNLINFSQALLLLKSGSKIARNSWPDNGEFYSLEKEAHSLNIHLYLNKNGNVKIEQFTFSLEETMVEDWYVMV